MVGVFNDLQIYPYVSFCLVFFFPLIYSLQLLLPIIYLFVFYITSSIILLLYLFNYFIYYFILHYLNLSYNWS